MSFIRSRFTTLRELTREALRIFSDRGARVLSGSIAFYSLVSVVPILVIALRVASVFVDPNQLDSTLFVQIGRWVGADGARTVMYLVGTVRNKSGSTLTNVFGALVLVYGATRLFSVVTGALDLLWNAPPKAAGRSFLDRVEAQFRKRALAFVMVLFVGLSLCALVLLHTVLAFTRHLVDLDTSPVSRGVEALASFVVTVLLFSLVFRLLPRATVTISDALTGGVVTASLFTLGSLAITAYVTRRDTTVYGAASSIVMLLLWVHYSAQAFFLGASFTAAHAARRKRLAVEAS